MSNQLDVPIIGRSHLILKNRICGKSQFDIVSYTFVRESLIDIFHVDHRSLINNSFKSNHDTDGNLFIDSVTQEFVSAIEFLI